VRVQAARRRADSSGRPRASVRRPKDFTFGIFSPQPFLAEVDETSKAILIVRIKHLRADNNDLEGKGRQRRNVDVRVREVIRVTDQRYSF